MDEGWLLRNVVKRLRRMLGDDADDPSYIFTEPRVGYRMPRGETQGIDAVSFSACTGQMTGKRRV